MWRLVLIFFFSLTADKDFLYFSYFIFFLFLLPILLLHHTWLWQRCTWKCNRKSTWMSTYKTVNMDTDPSHGLFAIALALQCHTCKPTLCATTQFMFFKIMSSFFPLIAFLFFSFFILFQLKYVAAVTTFPVVSTVIPHYATIMHN